MKMSLAKKILIVLMVSVVTFVAVVPNVRAAEEAGMAKKAGRVLLTPLFEMLKLTESAVAQGNAYLDTDEFKDLMTTFGLLTFFAGLTDHAARAEPFTNQQVNTGIEAGNRFLLNLINLFYILVLLLIAIATIFDVQQYSVTRLLPKLVIAILLSNFGLFFVQILADTGQLLTLGILGNGATTLASHVVGNLSDWEILKTTGIRAVGAIAAWVSGGTSVPLSFIYEATRPSNWFTVAFMLTTLVLWLRIVGLWVLAIFAPVGVALGVLPATQGMAKKYWQKVISYAFVGPVMIFFIRLAVIMFDALSGGTGNTPAVTTGTPSINTESYIRDLIVAIILFVGIAFTKKMGNEVATFAIGAFQKAFKTAFGAAMVFGSGGLKAVGSLIGGGKFAETTGLSLASRASTLSPEGQRLRGAQYLALSSSFSKLAGKNKDGFFGGAAKVFESASTPLLEDKKGSAKLLRAAGISSGAERAWENMQREEPSLAQEVGVNPPAFADRITRETDPTRREGLILGAIEAGKIVDDYDPANNINATNSIRWSDITRWIRPGQLSIMQGKAALRDPRLSEAYQAATTDDDRNNVLRRQLRRQDVSQLNAAALGNQSIARALFDVRKVDLPKFFKQWSDRQNRAFGTGLASSLDSIGNDEGSDRRWRDVARTALEKGASPDVVFSQERMARQHPRRSLMRDAVLSAAAGSASAYRLQSPAGALALARMAPVENIGKFVKLLPKQLQQALRQEARAVVGNAPPAAGAPQLSQERALEILGNIGVQIANNP